MDFSPQVLLDNLLDYAENCLNEDRVILAAMCVELALQIMKVEEHLEKTYNRAQRLRKSLVGEFTSKVYRFLLGR